MLKIILFSIIGKKIVSSRTLFNSLKAYLIVYMLTLPALLGAQLFEWVNTQPENFTLNPEMLRYATTADQAGSVYWCGMDGYIEHWNGLAYGGLFIKKFDTGGTLQNTVSATGTAAVLAAEALPAGALKLLVNTRSDLEFNDGSLIPNDDQETKQYLLSFAAAGELTWFQEVPGTENAIHATLTVDDVGNTYVAYADYADSYVVMYDAVGSFTLLIEQQGVPLISSIAVDNQLNLYVAGACATTESSFNGVLAEPGSSYNFYLAKYDAQQLLIWVKFVEDITCSFPQVACNDPDFVYFSGDLFTATSFDTIEVNGPSWVFDFFVARLNAAGEYLWVKEVPDPMTIAGDAALGKTAYAAVDEMNNLMVSGFIRGEIDWGDGMVTTSNGLGYDVLALCYAPDGVLLYAMSGGGELFDKSISGSSDQEGNYYMAAFGSEEVVFGQVSTYEAGVHPVLVKINNAGLISGYSGGSEAHSIRIFPNPASEYVELGPNVVTETIRVVRIYDVHGRVVLSEQAPFSRRFYVKNLPPGIYSLVLERSGETPWVVKLVKSGV